MLSTPILPWNLFYTTSQMDTSNVGKKELLCLDETKSEPFSLDMKPITISCHSE